jgi:hypothetical protein
LITAGSDPDSLAFWPCCLSCDDVFFEISGLSLAGGFGSADLRDRGEGDRRDFELEEESELTVMVSLKEWCVAMDSWDARWSVVIYIRSTSALKYHELEDD